MIFDVIEINQLRFLRSFIFIHFFFCMVTEYICDLRSYDQQQEGKEKARTIEFNINRIQPAKKVSNRCQPPSNITEHLSRNKLSGLSLLRVSLHLRHSALPHSAHVYSALRFRCCSCCCFVWPFIVLNSAIIKIKMTKKKLEYSMLQNML